MKRHWKELETDEWRRLWEAAAGARDEAAFGRFWYAIEDLFETGAGPVRVTLLPADTPAYTVSDTPWPRHYGGILAEEILSFIQK